MIGSIIAADYAFARGTRPLQSAPRFDANQSGRAGAPRADSAWPGATVHNPVDRTAPEAGGYLERWLA